MQFDEVLRTFSEFFEREGIRYAIVGLLYLYGTTADRIFAAASQRLVAGPVEAPVPKPEHLIAMKIQDQECAEADLGRRP